MKGCVRQPVLASAEVPSDGTVFGVAAAIFLVALAVYVATLAPTVFLIDSGLLTSLRHRTPALIRRAFPSF